MTKAHNKSGTGSQNPETGDTKTTPANKQVTGTSSTSGTTSQTKFTQTPISAFDEHPN